MCLSPPESKHVVGILFIDILCISSNAHSNLYKKYNIVVSSEICLKLSYLFKRITGRILLLTVWFAWIITTRERSCGKVIFSVMSVHHPVHRGVLCDYPWCIRLHCTAIPRTPPDLGRRTPPCPLPVTSGDHHWIKEPSPRLRALWAYPAWGIGWKPSQRAGFAHKAQGQGDGSYSNTICDWILCKLFLIYWQKMEILSQIVCCVKSSILNFWNSSVSEGRKMT